MNRVIVLIAIFTVGCVSLFDPVGFSELRARQAPPDQLLRANIFEIDGAAVSARKARYRIGPGTHRVCVWPVETTPKYPRRHFIDGAARTIAIELEFEAQPGQHYFFAAEQRRFNTASYAGDGRPLFKSSWQKVIVPVIFYTDDASATTKQLAAAY